jgi:hypothetical protein
MTDITSFLSTSFLSTELTEIGLVAAADPHFAERLLDALQRLPAERASVPASAGETIGARPEERYA